MSATSNAKAKAKRWMNGLLRANAKDNESTPGHRRGTTGNPSQYVDVNLAQSLDSMSLARDTRFNPTFIGGFHPALAPNSGHHSSVAPVVHAGPGPLPCPPKMSLPVPDSHSNYSKTMQYALHDQHRPIHANLSPLPSAPNPIMDSGHRLPPASSSKPAVKPRKDTDSTVNINQCAAFTKAGKRCTRQIKAETPSEATGRGTAARMVPRYCFQHVKEINSATGFYARKNGLWVDYKNWIPNHLLPETQATLRAEMEKAHSGNDTAGYIYTFEIREPGSTTIKFKIGRATNHVRRLDQWGKQCGSKEQVRLGVYPEPDGGITSNLRGLQELDPTRKAAWCHRLERLIHLELADIVNTKVYLDPAWPSPKVPYSKNKAATQSVRNCDPFADKQPCADCGCVHKEIFEFQRIENGRYKGREYELIVKPIIEKWGGFVDDFV